MARLSRSFGTLFSFYLKSFKFIPPMKICSLLFLVLVTGVIIGSAEPKFKKITLDDMFRSEGVGIGDFNKDGKNDVAVGDYWYAAPDWKRHEIRKPRKQTRGGYTEAFAVYPDDYNRDGWIDLMVIPFHGKSAKWYENPKNKGEGHWKEHEAFKGTGNETRLYLDLFADGKKVFLMGVEGKIAWVPVPEVSKVNELWSHNVIGDEPKPAHQYAHGLGASDVNGDGLLDVTWGGGWWAQPKDKSGKGGKWTYHSKQIVKDGVADMYHLDADGDGLNDILCTSAHGTGIYWCKQKEDGSFETNSFHKGLIRETHSANYVDVNGDGRKDLVTGRRFFAHGYRPSLAGQASELYWFDIKTAKGNAPEFVPHKIDDQSGVGAQFLTVDFNGDKKIDVVVSNRKGVFLFLQE